MVSYDVKPEFKINMIVGLINDMQFRMEGDSLWRAVGKLPLILFVTRNILKVANIVIIGL